MEREKAPTILVHLTHLKVQHLSCLPRRHRGLRFTLAWALLADPLYYRPQSDIIHHFLCPFVSQFQHMKNQKGAHCFLGRAQQKKKKEKKKSLSSIFSALFLIVAWATIHAYVWRLCAINYVVLRSQALAGDNSHPHISDL